MRRRPRRWWRMVAAATLALCVPGVWWGCTSPYPDQNYGDPTGLRSQNLPGEGGVVITGACEAGLPPDILAVPEGGVPEGGTSSCKVSFSRNLYPRFLGDGGWRCAAPACHGGSQPPVMDASSPESILGSLRDYKLTGLPYIAPSTSGSSDPTKSGIYCNLSRTCGAAMPPSPPLSAQEVCALETWLRCGAPSN